MTTRLALSLRFVRARLFATPLDAVITLACCWTLARLLEPLARWLVIDATFRGVTRADCTGAGA
jgi:general L-amino acid transport system permease protein